MTKEQLDNALNRAIGRLQLLVQNVGRGVYDDVDPRLLLQLKISAHDLYTALDITDVVIKD